MSVCFQVSYSFSLFYLPLLDVRLCMLLYPDNKLKKNPYWHVYSLALIAQSEENENY